MKYSIIIPVYNAEKTLNRCVDSLLAQDCSEAEIILVNDGSKDGSGSICEEYAKAYKNIRYVSKQNGGVSSARNAGLDMATGEYVLFVDSDDYVTCEFFSCIDNSTLGDSADFVQFSGIYDNGYEKKSAARKPMSIGSRDELFPHIIYDICNKYINSPWANLYKRSIIEENNIRFPVGVSVGEDRAFNIVYSFYIQSYSASEKTVYVVNTENENSLSRKRHADLIDQYAITESFLDRKLTEAPISDSEKAGYRRALNFGSCISIYHDAKLMIQDRIGWMARQKRLMLLCRDINKKHMKYPNTRYCKQITLPVRLYLTPVIDAVGFRLARNC